jgi:hypothetical protein
MPSADSAMQIQSQLHCIMYMYGQASSQWFVVYSNNAVLNEPYNKTSPAPLTSVPTETAFSQAAKHLPALRAGPCIGHFE